MINKEKGGGRTQYFFGGQTAIPFLKKKTCPTGHSKDGSCLFFFVRYEFQVFVIYLYLNATVCIFYEKYAVLQSFFRIYLSFFVLYFLRVQMHFPYSLEALASASSQ